MSWKAETQAVYVMWLRQIKRFFRAKSRIVASIVQPLFFLFILGAGFNRAIIPGMTGNYIEFLAPAIVGMAILFSSMFAGISVLWDKQFGFLQEVLVAPVSRFSIIAGRTLGGATTALFQGSLVVILSLFLGIQFLSPFHVLLTIVMMIVIACTAVGFGLILASRISDFQAFPLIMNIVIMPLFFLSTAFFPLEGLPSQMQPVVLFNPLFYMVDGLRGSIMGINNTFHPLVDLGILCLLCIIFLGLGSYFFSKSEA